MNRLRTLFAPALIALLLCIAYLDYPRRFVDDAVDAGAGVVTLSVDGGATDERRTHIGNYWARWDSAVDVPNYPIRILPTSGVVQTPQWYSLIAEARILVSGK